MQNYLGSEMISKEILSKLHSRDREVGKLERAIFESIQLEHKHYQHMGELESLREHIFRLVSSKVQLCNEANEKIRIADLIIGFLGKKNLDWQKDFDKLMKLHNFMRSQRNKLISLIQASAITLAGLKDTLKRLEVEFNMLQGEACYKDKVLFQMRKELISSVHSRFDLQGEHIKSSILLKQRKLKRAVAEGERLSDLVERPENTARWKLLEGTDPNEMQLLAKLSDIEEHLTEREDQSLEKDLILEEVTALAEDVRKQAGERWRKSMALGRRVIYHHHCIRTITHGMMSTVSELSLIQAKAMCLQKEKNDLINLLEEAYTKLDDGDAHIQVFSNTN
eukprot:c39108_g1_i1 orf=174-1184(-)